MVSVATDFAEIKDESERSGYRLVGFDREKVDNAGYTANELKRLQDTVRQLQGSINAIRNELNREPAATAPSPPLDDELTPAQTEPPAPAESDEILLLDPEAAAGETQPAQPPAEAELTDMEEIEEHLLACYRRRRMLEQQIQSVKTATETAKQEWEAAKETAKKDTKEGWRNLGPAASKYNELLHAQSLLEQEQAKGDSAIEQLEAKL
ncbi:MAG: hypothetical protein KF708_01590 [Pirellulales bacterium]|nr:hypothetical protein [Pirellulales bacterium]